MILELSNASDPAVDAYRHVGDHEWLRARGLFVAEGRLVVDRLVTNGRYRIESVLVTPAALSALRAQLTRLDAPVLLAPPPLLNEITGFNFHRGCLALAERAAPSAFDDVVGGRLLLGLEAVGNPDNIGGLFRTASAFGVTGVLIDKRTGDPFYRKALRTSMAAALEMPFASVDGWPSAFDRLRDRGALTPDSAADSLFDFVRTISPERQLVIVGSEGAGLTRGVLAAADRRVRIPIASGVDSLNVAVAAGVALAEIVGARARLGL